MKAIWAWCRRHLGVLLSVFATGVYLLTMDRSASWWDCGEFIATGWQLGVGHPSGAPTYQLVQHVVMLLCFGNTMLVAPLSNALSAVCGGVTVGLLYSTIRHLGGKPLGALAGALCYLFCDTAWFSAVESEVYSMAMLFCSLDLWMALRWRRTGNARLLVLLGLLLGLGIGVHLMTLLVAPAVALVIISHYRRTGGTSRGGIAKLLVWGLLFFLLGLTPYAIIPLRAAADPPINEMNGSFGAYLRREQYEKAPLYPRMWRERDSENWDEWNLGRTDFVGNTVYYVTYQLGYMYGRYILNNFAGRINHKSQRTVLYILPLLLALWGLWRHRKQNRLDYWVVMLVFLFGGVLLNLYLNHPCYEPRSRDYAYVLSFYAIAIWIGIGADDAKRKMDDGIRHRSSHILRLASYLLLLLAPLTLAVGNWSDHDRSHCHSVHDIATNHLESCDEGAVLITLGDNDTFPLWYLQQVEGKRTDISIYNVGLTGWEEVFRLIESADRQPVYFTHYFQQRYAYLFPGRLRCEGFCWRLLPTGENDLTPRVHDGIEWHITPNEYIDPVSRKFLHIWEEYKASL